MRSLLWCLLVLLPLSLRAETVLVLGDSLSAAYRMPVERGWVSLLQQRLVSDMPGYQVVNASISGETSQGGLSRLPGLLQQHRPDLVVIELGANDGLRGTPPARLRQNLRTLIELSQQAGAQVMLLGIRLPPNYGPAYNAQFEVIFSELSAEMKVGLVPFFMARVALKPALMQSDGLHPNARAQPVLLDTVWPRLQPVLLDLAR